MAAHGWGKSASVEEWLLAEAHRFDFYEAVALLEAMSRRPHSVGERSEPSKEAVRFKSIISLGFPETDVDSVDANPQGEDDTRSFAMKVNFMSLAGAVGPLPNAFSELIMQRAARHDTAARDFLDIFNHRLISIAYRIRKRHRVGLGVISPLDSDVARYLFALMGLGTPGISRVARERYRSLLHYSGMFAKEMRSMAGLVSVLRYHFGVPIEGVQMTGRYYPLDEEERTSIGPNGANRTLGHGTVLGTRVWDQTASFEVRVGPLLIEEFLRFLPTGDAIRPLCEITRLYAGVTFDFSVCLILKASNVPKTELGWTPGNLLGYTAWIGSARREKGPPEVQLSYEVIERVLSKRNPFERRVENKGAARPGPAV